MTSHEHPICAAERNMNPCQHPKSVNPPSIRLLLVCLSEIWSKLWPFMDNSALRPPTTTRGFAIIERDGIALQFNVSDATQEPPEEGCRVCYIGVTNIEALYQQYVPTGAIRSPLPLQATPWGTKGFWLCDPFRNILIFEESLPEEERSQETA